MNVNFKVKKKAKQAPNDTLITFYMPRNTMQVLRHPIDAYFNSKIKSTKSFDFGADGPCTGVGSTSCTLVKEFFISFISIGLPAPNFSKSMSNGFLSMRRQLKWYQMRFKLFYRSSYQNLKKYQIWKKVTQKLILRKLLIFPKVFMLELAKRLLNVYICTKYSSHTLSPCLLTFCTFG